MMNTIATGRREEGHLAALGRELGWHALGAGGQPK